MNYEWQLLQPDEKAVLEYMRDLNIERILATYFVNHGVSKEMAAEVMDVSYKGIFYPLAIQNIHEAAALIKKYLDKPKVSFHLFADYDTDGITSASILYKGLAQIIKTIHPRKEIPIWYSIPERKEGYGLSVDFANKFIKVAGMHPDVEYLVITVDNGITAKPAVDILLTAPNVCVLVTDHHEPDFENNLTPTKECICVDPQLAPGSPGELLAGCGVIYNVLQELEDLCNIDHSITISLFYLMAIGTVGDMMDMDLYHGCVIGAGLQQLNRKDSVQWVRMIRERMGIEHFTAKDLAFTISPMINSCGQMGMAKLPFQMIIAAEEDETIDLFNQVYSIYQTNKAETKEAKEAAEFDIRENYKPDHRFILYPMHTEHPGLVSKVTTFLAKELGMPIIVWSETAENQNEETLTGSARNDTNLPVFQIAREAVRAGLIQSAEGHSYAFGVKLYRSKLAMLQKFLDDKVEAYERDNGPVIVKSKGLSIDCIVSTDDINVQNMRDLEQFPFVRNWPAPVVMIQGAKICSVKASRNNPKNLCYTIQSPGAIRPIEIWAWNIKPDEYQEGVHTKIDMIGTIERDFRMPRYATLSVMDLKCYS